MQLISAHLGVDLHSSVSCLPCLSFCVSQTQPNRSLALTYYPSLSLLLFSLLSNGCQALGKPWLCVWSSRFVGCVAEKSFWLSPFRCGSERPPERNCLLNAFPLPAPSLTHPLPIHLCCLFSASLFYKTTLWQLWHVKEFFWVYFKNTILCFLNAGKCSRCFFFFLL